MLFSKPASLCTHGCTANICMQLDRLLNGTEELYSHRNGAIYRWIRNLKQILRSEIKTWLVCCLAAGVAICFLRVRACYGPARRHLSVLTQKNFDNNTEELTEQPAAVREVTGGK